MVSVVSLLPFRGRPLVWFKGEGPGAAMGTLEDEVAILLDGLAPGAAGKTAVGLSEAGGRVATAPPAWRRSCS